MGITITIGLLWIVNTVLKDVVAQYFKFPFVNMTSLIKVLALALAGVLQTQLPANVPEKAVNGGSDILVLFTHAGGQDGAPISSF